MEDRFAGIADDYDRMFPRDLEADRAMLLSVMERHGARSVLDCACGTGVHTEILTREGFRVVGSDASWRMLEVAREKLAAAGLEADLYRSRWRDLPAVLPGRYDAVICMGNSLALEPDDKAVIGSLAGMYAMLEDGGVLLVSGTNVDRALAERVEIEVVEPEPESFLMLVRDFGEDGTSHRFFYIDASTEEPEMRYFRFELLNLTVSRLEPLVRQAGIDTFRFYGEKDLAPYSRLESERLILIAEKRP